MGGMNTSEILRALENLIKRGVVHSVDAAAGSVRVEIGALITDDLPYFVPAAGGVSVHRPPSAGESCIVFSPSGDTAAGVVLCGIASDAHPQPSQSAGETVTRYPDGAVVSYNHQSSAMSISGIKTGVINAATGLTFNTPLAEFSAQVKINGLLTYAGGMSGSGGGGTAITGALNHVGTLTNAGEITSNGVALSTHKHTGVLAGGATTGEPQK